MAARHCVLGIRRQAHNRALGAWYSTGHLRTEREASRHSDPQLQVGRSCKMLQGARLRNRWKKLHLFGFNTLMLKTRLQVLPNAV